jgi:O-antigen/teichoic acid export membrane protein
LQRWLQPGLLANIGANGLGQIFQLLIQLVSVPIYVHSLGTERYGVWLLFVTLPTFFTVSDLGLTVSFGNDMTARVARGDLAGTRTTYRALTRSLLSLAAALVTLTMLLLGLVFPEILAAAAKACDGQPLTVLGLIIAYGLGVLHCGATFAGFRATGEFSVAAYRMQWIALAEAMAAVAMAVAGLGLPAMAAALAAVRIAGAIWLWWLLRRRHPFLFAGSTTSLRERGLALLPAAVAAFALPLSNLLVLQASVVLIGMLAGAAAVPAYTATRTVTRLALQIGMIVNNASLPDFTAAHARNEEERKQDLLALSILAACLTVLPAALVIFPFGSTLVGIWTDQRITSPDLLVAAMGLSMVVSGYWLPLSNFLLAIGRQASFSWIYLLIALIALAVGALAIPSLGATGIAWAIALADCLMLGVILERAARFGLIDSSTIKSFPARIAGLLRNYTRE